MEGGDLKQMVISNMQDPFNPTYSKVDALRWCMQVSAAAAAAAVTLAAIAANQ